MLRPLNEKKVSKYSPRGSSESSIVIFGWVLACSGTRLNKVTDDSDADINRELTHKKLCALVP